MQEIEIKELAEEIREQLQEMPTKNPEYCIDRVRRGDREACKVSYIPMTISIGPLHHNRRDLNTMEKYKQQYTKSFLNQTPNMFLEDYIKVLTTLEDKVRKCYGQEIELSSRNFTKMMFYDGCFILQLLLKFNKEVEISEDDDDMIFKRIGMLSRIKRDMILFENQIPFFVLQCLFNLSTVFNGGPLLIELVLNFFSDMIPGHKRVLKEKGVEVKHLLDLLRRSYEPTQIESNSIDHDPQVLMYSAIDLKIKGEVRFKKAYKPQSLLDIKFYSNRLVEIPELKIQPETGTLFRNFMAFEQCCEKSNAYITDYISFMGGLIKAWDDANLLCDIGIIESQLPFDPLVISDLFRNLSKGLVVYNCYYSRLCKKVNLCCIKNLQPWPPWMDQESFIYHCCSIFNIFGSILVLFVVWMYCI